MAVVVNVLCIFKDVGGDELTAVQGANSLSFGPVYLLRTQCLNMMNLDSPATFKLSLPNKTTAQSVGLQLDQIHLLWDVLK